MTLRLLMDEHFSPEIARQLRTRDHDVVAARARVELHGLGDRELLALTTSERRALVTENVADFAELHRQSVVRGDPHAGLVFTSPRRFPRTRRSIGRLVQALDRLVADGPPGLDGQTWWLS
jgi:predicted nuclease of predicted toxin-antitoxin system